MEKKNRTVREKKKRKTEKRKKIEIVYTYSQTYEGKKICLETH